VKGGDSGAALGDLVTRLGVSLWLAGSETAAPKAAAEPSRARLVRGRMIVAWSLLSALWLGPAPLVRMLLFCGRELRAVAF